MLQAMNTGHEGSLTTIHANSPRDALARLETLVLTAGVELPHRAIREQIASAFDLLVQIERLVDGSRRVTHISEVLGMESDVVTLQDIFVASPPERGSRPTRWRTGCSRRSAPPGLKPHFLEKLAANNVVLPPSFFAADDSDQVRAIVRGDRVRRWLRMKRVARQRSPLSRLDSCPRRPLPPDPRIQAVDTSGFPSIRVTYVAPLGIDQRPLRENGRPVTGSQAINLGQTKSIVVAIDRSQSMRGRPLANAIAAGEAVRLERRRRRSRRRRRLRPYRRSR